MKEETIEPRRFHTVLLAGVFKSSWKGQLSYRNLRFAKVSTQWVVIYNLKKTKMYIFLISLKSLKMPEETIYNL